MKRWLIHDRDNLPAYGYSDYQAAQSGVERINTHANRGSGSPYHAVLYVSPSPEQRMAVNVATEQLRYLGNQCRDHGFTGDADEWYRLATVLENLFST